MTLEVADRLGLDRKKLVSHRYSCHMLDWVGWGGVVRWVLRTAAVP